MKKSKEGGASALRIKEFKEAFRLEIEKYLIDHECTTNESINLIVIALYDIFESIAKTENLSHDEVFGTFVKTFGVWDYLKTMKEG